MSTKEDNAAKRDTKKKMAFSNILDKLAFKIGAIIIATEIVVLIVIGYIYMDHFSKEIDRRMETQVRVPALLINQGLLSFDSIADEKKMRSIIQDNFIDGMVAVRNRRVFFSKNPDHIGKDIAYVTQLASEMFDFNNPKETIVYGYGDVTAISPIFIANRKRPLYYSYLKIGSNKAVAEKNRMAFLLILGSAITVILTSTIIIISVKFVILNRIRKTLSVLHYAEGGDLNAKIEGRIAKDEMGLLQDGVNSMISELKVTIDDLKTEIIVRKQSEEKHNTIIKTALDGFSIISLEGRLLEVNDAYCNMVGYTREELLNMSVQDIEFKESDDETARHIEKMVEQGSDRFETRHKCKDGRIIDIEVSANYLDVGEGQLFIFLHDITERKQAEEKIKEYSKGLEEMVEDRTQKLNRALYDTEEARDRIDAILKSVGDGLIVTDIYNRITLMNRAAENLLNVRFSEVIDRPIDFAIEDKTLRDRIKHTLDKKKEGYEFDFELPAEDGTGHHRTMRARTSIIADKTGKHTGIITIMQDVTHEREVDRMKTEFISTAAHELRTPLTSIRGFSEILLKRDDIKKKEKNKFLTYINDQSVCLSNIINDLLDISRIESKLGFTLNKSPCNVVDIIQNVVSQFKDQSSKHSFDTTLAEKSVELNIDKEKIAQVLQNILSNAVKYSPDGGTIKIKGISLENHYEVSVEDEGIGMSPDQVDKIFEKFFRADASNTAIPGTGLGMSIVKYLVEAHGGEVRVESEFDKGTTVRFTISI